MFLLPDFAVRCVNTLSVVLWLVNLQNVTEKRKTAEEEEEEEEEVKKKNLKNCVNACFGTNSARRQGGKKERKKKHSAVVCLWSWRLLNWLALGYHHTIVLQVFQI